MHRLAITGVGTISCLGNGAAAVQEALREGRSGVVVGPERVRLGFRSALRGMVRGLERAAPGVIIRGDFALAGANASIVRRRYEG